MSKFMLDDADLAIISTRSNLSDLERRLLEEVTKYREMLYVCEEQAEKALDLVPTWLEDRGVDELVDCLHEILEVREG